MEKRKYELGRKSPEEIIKSEGLGEHSYIRAPGGELIPTTKRSGSNEVEVDDSIRLKFFQERGYKPYQEVHTHSYRPGGFAWARGLPHPNDLKGALKERGQIRTNTIAQKNWETNELEGYTNLHDKRGDQTAGELHNAQQDMNKAMNELEKEFTGGSMSTGEYNQRLMRIAKDQGFDYRFHPARGYYFDKESGNYKKAKPNLGTAVASVIAGFTLLFLLTKVSFTGFVISDSVKTNFGTGLFLLSGSLFALITYFILRKAVRNS